MAPSPWPDYQCTEPKAPDKNSDNNVPSSSPSNSQNPPKPLTKNDPAEGDKDPDDVEILAELKPQVTALDESGLKALLDEAMSFRLPKDVEGKSVLFKGLLEEVNSKKTPRTVSHTVMPKQGSSSGKSSKKHKFRRSHISSDQNETPAYVRHKSESKNCNKPALVSKNLDMSDENCSKESSKRTPVNINDSCRLTGMIELVVSDDKIPFEDGLADDLSKKRKGHLDDLVKTCEVRNVAKIVTVPSGNKNYSDNANSKNMIKIPPDYTKRPKEHFTPNFEKFCRKIDAKDYERVKALNKTQGIVKEISIPSTQFESCKVSSEVLQSQFENLEDLIELESSKPLERCDQPAENGVNNTNYLKEMAVDDSIGKIKKIDENGNALNSKIDDGRKGKPRRVKTKNDRNTIMSQNIEGYRGDSDIEAVIQYIESNNKNHGKNGKPSGTALSFPKQGRLPNKFRQIRDKSSETVGRKGKKNKDTKFQKSSSLEEVSTSKLEDLTNEAPKSLENPEFSNKTFDYDLDVKTNNIINESVPSPVVIPNNISEKNKTSNLSTVKASPDMKRECKTDSEPSGDLEFHIVTKKHRKKKRSMTYSGGRNMKAVNSGVNKMVRRFTEVNRSRKDMTYKNPRCQGESRGRKPASSVPPSDKSADSSDVDSVHSLPVSSSTSALKINNSTNDPISLTSYADIARSVTTPPTGRSTPTLNKSNGNQVLHPLGKAQCVSNEEITSVTLTIPKNRRKTPPSSLIVNDDKEYPPLKSLESKRKNDMFVEFTVQLPKAEDNFEKEACVEETVCIKIPAENKNISESTTMSLTLENPQCKRPPVILMDEKTVESGAANELVFGFEVNQQLLIGQSDAVSHQPKSLEDNVSCVKENDENEEGAAKSDAIEVGSQKKEFNLMDIVCYLSSEWDAVVAELNGDQNKGQVYYFQP